MTIVVMRNVFSHFKHDLLMSLFSFIVISYTEGYFQAAVDTYCVSLLLNYTKVIHIIIPEYELLWYMYNEVSSIGKMEYEIWHMIYKYYIAY